MSAKSKSAAAKKSKRQEDDDDEEKLPLWKKGMLVAASLFLAWWMGSVVIGMISASSRYDPLSATAICREFKTNAEDARKKYVGNSFEISGKVKIVENPQGARLVFDTPDAADWAIHCVFANKKLAAKMAQTLGKSDKPDVVVEGYCRLPKERGIILMDDCIVRKGL